MTRLVSCLGPALLAASALGALAACNSGTAQPPRPTPALHRLVGTHGNDRLVGTAGDDHIEGFAGSDVIHGLAGDDVLEGGEGGGYDRLVGGEGDDTLRLVESGSAYGGPGDDTIRGVYLFSRSLIDCGPGRDHLYLTDTTEAYVTVRSCETVTTTPVD
ncbi:MAG: hypothetical protein ACJ716_02940 [Marmoricola sp.]